MRGGTPDIADGLFPATNGEFGDGLAEHLRARVKAVLEPAERLLWEGRGHARPLAAIPAFPAFFAAFLCATSGFALTVLFGIFGFRPMDREMVFLLCLAPGVLGGVAAVGMTSGWARHRFSQRRIARSVYALTDRRAIVGRPWRGDIVFFSWVAEPFLDAQCAGWFQNTCCIEHGDGLGSVYFLHYGEVSMPDFGFEGIRGAGRVEVMIREVLLREKVLSGADLAEL
jgi:hypothetical protein